MELFSGEWRNEWIIGNVPMKAVCISVQCAGTFKTLTHRNVRVGLKMTALA